MEHTKQILLIILLLFTYPIFSQDIKPEEVKKIMKKVADWEIKHHDDLAYRAQNSRLSRGKHDMLDWTNGALYVGMSKWAAMADSEKYFDWLRGIGEDHDWKLHMRNGYYARVFHADDHTV